MGSRKSRCFPDQDPDRGIAGGRQFPPGACRETAAGAAWPTPGARTDSEWRRGRGWHLCHPRCRIRCHETERRSRAPDAASGRGPSDTAKGDARPPGRKRRIGHDVALKRLHEGDTRILAAAAAVWTPLIIGFWLKRNAEPLDAGRVSGFIEPHSRDADARVISFRDQPRKKIELAIRAASRGRIQDAFDLLRIAGFRLHQHAEALVA